MSFRLAYLDMISAHSQGHGESRFYFHYKYL